MAGGKNFNFKHRNPADVTATTKKEILNDESQEESIEHRSQSIKSAGTDTCIIKPKESLEIAEYSFCSPKAII